MDVPDLARVRVALRGPEPAREAPLPDGAAAVLLPLLQRDGELAVLFTRRHHGLAMHAGQISFPGGRIDRQDKGPAEAALRETQEEVGLPPEALEVLGHLADYTTYYGRLVCCYVGAVSPRAPEPYLASPQEVTQLLVIPLRRLLAGEGYEGRRLPGDPRRETVHYWHLPEATVWGITAELMTRFLARVAGWSPPRGPSTIASAEEFRDLARRGL